MGVLPSAGEDEEAAGGRLNQRVGAPVRVEKLEEAALELLAVLAEVEQARVVVVRRVVLVDVGVPEGVCVFVNA